jgi:hypothetical protein
VQSKHTITASLHHHAIHINKKKHIYILKVIIRSRERNLSLRLVGVGSHNRICTSLSSTCSTFSLCAIAAV